MKEVLLMILSHPEYEVLVGTIAGGVVGWMQLQYTLCIEIGAYVELNGLVVDVGLRGQGLGRLLIREAAHWAKAKRCGRLRVRCNVLRTENHKFYEKIGFKLKKEQKVFDSIL